ncbi:hypothetical protein AGOR_G00027440 [Albula goreensis]|uniref:Alpha-2-macroglobulin-like n=1 Tax=Albula goreensis TaxID=1534307 RepID=A0A8T3E2K3_9TELE|nr:hypothetical protein AGOR_G00027440 [Albula goreensis]
MLGLLLTTCILLQTVISGSPDDPIYMVTVTSQTSGGGTEMLCAQILLLKEPLSIMVTLQTPGVSNTTILEESVTTKFQRCVQFQVPFVSTDTVAIVHASVQGEKTSLSSNTKILIKAISKVVTIIQTDKPIYKPGQRVMFRIVSLDAGLLPYSQMYKTVELQDPDSNRIAQWLNQSNTGGILDLSHPTTPEAKQGIYKLTSWAEKGQKTIHTFEVKEYVLPKFEVTVHLPAVISDKDEEVTVKICGKYTYGKPVQGEIIAEICRRMSPGYWGGFHTGVCRKYTMRTDKAGCASQNVDLKPFAVVSKETRSESTFDVECMITEDGTGVVLKGSGSRTFNHNRFCSEVEISAPTSFIPGKMVEGKIIVKGPRSSPMANMTVSYGVDISSAMSSENLTQLTTDSKGVAYFSLDTSAWEKGTYSIEARCPRGKKEINAVYSSPLDEKFVIDRHVMVPFYSKTKSFLKIKQADGALPCDKDAQIRIQYSIQGVELKDMQALDVFYLAQSKGGIVQHGSHEVRLSSGEAERGELSIPLQRMAELAPLVQVVVYMVLPNREVVADSRDLRVQLCFRNKVSLQFSSPQKLPGEKTFLEVQAEPGSLCSLRAIDQSVVLMKPEQELSAETVYENLPVQSLSDYPRSIRNNFCGRKKRFRPSKHMVLRDDVLSLFQDVGIKVLTNLEIKRPGCYLQIAYMSPVDHVYFQFSGSAGPSQEGLPTVHPMRSPSETIRSFFPETWIWELIPVGDSGRAKVEHTVPDTITEWVGSGFCTSPAGFGLATNVGLTAFQPFFISLTLPYSVIRGEEFTLRATVFSYLSKCMMVEVRLADSTAFTAQPCTGCDYRRCVCGGASETFSWVLTPTSLGKVDIKVSAEALNTGELCDNEVVTVPERGQIDTSFVHCW